MNEMANSHANQKRQILKAISGDFEPPRMSSLYFIGLMLTASAVLLLPVLYIALIVLVLGGTFTFVQQANVILIGWQPMAKSVTVGVVICCGMILALGLTKPFLLRSFAVKRPRVLNRDAEPFLYEYVNRLCDALGACRPTDIRVTCDPNAGAEIQNGWWNIFGRGEMSLHLGLPLIAGLTLRQFTGVLAHELGHCRQRSAMWVENLVWRVNPWLLQSAYQRDSIDNWLANRCAARGLAAIICRVVCALVWVTRLPLRGLACIGPYISCLMSREMEFNADRCEVRTVGTGTFATTMWRMRILSLAHQISFRDVAAFCEEGRLPDNMIALAAANTSFVSPKVKKKLRRVMNEGTTGLFDSYPSDQDRICSVLADGSPGFFQPGSLSKDLPASVLFSQFDEISKVATAHFYEQMLNQPITPRMLHPVHKLLERQNLEIEASKALQRYFQADIPLLRPLPIAPQSADKPENPEEVSRELEACRQRMMSELPNYKRLIPRYQMAEETFFETIAAQSLLQARLQFRPLEYHLPSVNGDVVSDKQVRAREGVANLAAKLLPFESEAGNRLSFALQLLHIPDVLQKIPDGDELYFEVEGLLPEAQYVSRLIGELPSLRITFHRLVTLCERSNDETSNERLVDLIVDQKGTLRNRLISIQAEMGGHLYPFDHALTNTTLQEYALPQVPSDRDLEGLIEATERMQTRLISVQTRLFSRLAQAAEKIEAAIGMPPLPSPSDVDD